MNHETLSIDRLIPYARNARTHNDKQVAQIAASIKEFGFCNPVLIDENDGIIAGHGRVLAARKLKITDIPCVRLTHLSESQKRAYIIADNKLALNAGWDDELLKLEFTDLKMMDFDIQLTGFDGSELSLINFNTESENTPKSSSKEINPDDYQMGCKCPRCGFEFDDK